MAPKLAKGMDPLGDISSDDEAGSESEGGDAAAPAAPPKPKEVDFEALQKAGYKGCVGWSAPATAWQPAAPERSAAGASGASPSTSAADVRAAPLRPRAAGPPCCTSRSSGPRPSRTGTGAHDVSSATRLMQGSRVRCAGARARRAAAARPTAPPSATRRATRWAPGWTRRSRRSCARRSTQTGCARRRDRRRRSCARRRAAAAQGCVARARVAAHAAASAGERLR